MAEVGKLVAKVIYDVKSQSIVAEVPNAVLALTEQFPLYAWKHAAAAVS